MTYIVDELGNNLSRYRKIRDSDDYEGDVREEARIIASYITLLLCRIANGSVTIEQNGHDETGEMER